MRRVSCICHWGAAAALAAAAGLAHAHEVGGRVVAVQDGDTVTILDAARVQHRVRIAGIDAPEKSQAFGEVAKQSLARLVHGRHVEARCPKRDRFGREVCSVFLGTRDVGLEQVQAGYAWWYREYAREQRPEDRVAYEAAEAGARQARRGLWHDPAPEPPSAFRRQQTKPRGA
jgi:endonuclease YncB( thermonuclease family)